MVFSPISMVLGSGFHCVVFMTRHDNLEGEACNEEMLKLAMGADTKRTRLEIASLFFDNIPPFI